MAHAWTIRREVDLARDFVGVERIAALATTSAKAAHELHIAVKSGGEPIGMDGASVLLNLILPDGVSTTADGRIEAGACIAMLPSLCYQRGETRGVLLLQFGTQAAIPVYAFVLRCFEDLTDAFADPDHVIPSLAELLAQLDAAKNAVKAAQDGASAANAAAGAANAAAGNANEAAGMASAAANTANTAAIHANSAKEAANAAAARLDGLTATATGLDAGSAPTVDVTTGEDGARVLSFGIPKGDKGDTGATGPQGPKGDTGDIGNLTINGKAPDGSGAVTLKPEDLGAASAESVSSLKTDIRVNLIRLTFQTETKKGVTCTNNGDGTFTLNGTCDGGTAFIINNKLPKINNIKLTGEPDNVSKCWLGILKDRNYNNIIFSNGVGNIDGAENLLLMQCNDGGTYNNLVFKPMITTDLNATYDDFVSYDDSFVTGRDVIDKSSIGDAWTAGKTYAVGDYCISGNQLYKCKTAHTAGSTFNLGYWVTSNVCAEIKANNDTYTIDASKFFADNSKIDTASILKCGNVVRLTIKFNSISFSEDDVLAKINPEYAPKAVTYTTGFIYGLDTVIDITLTSWGDIKVFGAHTIESKRLYIAVTYII